MENKNADLSSLKIDRSSDTDNKGNNSNITKTVVTAVIIILIGVLAYFGFNKLFAKGVEAKVATVTRISPSESSAVLTASGYVVAQRKASVASKATGRLVYLGVVEGDAVKKGQIIARLEDNDVKAALAQVKANLELNKSTLQDAKNNYERQEKYVDCGVKPPICQYEGILYLLLKKMCIYCHYPIDMSCDVNTKPHFITDLMANKKTAEDTTKG